MTDRLGIVTQYNGSDATQAAILLADHAQLSGVPVSCFAVGTPNRFVDSRWDSRIIVESKQHFTDWAQRHTRILWTHVPNPGEVLFAQELGVQTAILLEGSHLDPDDGESLREVDKLLSINRFVGRLVQDYWNIPKKSFVYMPLAFPTVPASRSISSRRIFWATHTSQAEYTPIIIFDLLRELLEQDESIELVVSYSACFDNKAYRKFRSLRALGESRVRVFRRPERTFQRRLMSEATLTLSPALSDSFGIVGLSSLSVGTPVLSWNAKPQNEYLSNGVNSVLVSASMERRGLAAIFVRREMQDLIKVVSDVLKNETQLCKMRKCAIDTSREREKQFAAGWEKWLKS